MLNINRWNPAREFEAMSREMDRMVNEALAPAKRGNFFTPAFDLSETQQEYVVEAELPGVKAEDVKLTLDNGVLTISGEARQERRTEEQSYHRIERSYGSFRRSLSLPRTVKADAISAELKDGVLTVRIPKAEEAQPRQIPVGTSQGALPNGQTVEAEATA
jgi:HSP20 family protein